MSKTRRERREAERLQKTANGDKTQPGKGLDGPEKVAAMSAVDRIREAWAEIARLIGEMKPRYVLFARRLAAGAHQNQAAIDAGYSVSSSTAQGSRLAADPQVIELVEWLLKHDVLTETHISRPALRQVLIEVMAGQGVSAADRVAAVRAGSKLEGFDRIKVEVTGGTPALDGDALRKELADRLARQMSKQED